MKVVRFASVVVLMLACSRQRAAEPQRDAAAAAATATATPVDAAVVIHRDAATAREPLSGFPWQMDLVDASGAKLGVLAVPVGAREPRPIMIALHGGSDRPEWACNAWRGITGAYPFIVCPRGPGSDAALAWSSPADTKARAARAVAAMMKMFNGDDGGLNASWVRETSVVILVGFSMGATQAALQAQSDPKRYPRVVLAESAYAPEPVMTFAKPWAAGGGQRAIFLCTTKGCEGTYRNAGRNVAEHHVPARMNIAGTTEHGMWDQVVRSMRRDWPWLVEGVEGWEAYAPAAEEAPLPGKTEIFEPR